MFDTQNFRDKMAMLERRHEEVGALLALPDVINKRGEFMKLSREHAELDPLVSAWKSYQRLLDELGKARQMIEAEPSADLRDLAREEVQQLESARSSAE